MAGSGNTPPLPPSDPSLSPAPSVPSTVAEADPAGDQRPANQRRRAVALGLGLVVVLFVALTPWPLDAKLRLVGAACCAQAPTRTLSFGGQAMPLDARDAGLYLTLLLALAAAVVVGRGRSAHWPPRPLLALLGGLFVAMVVDGINSTLQTRGLHGLYPTTNPIRVITGAGAGLALAVLGLPLVNRVVWRVPEDEAVLEDYTELAGFVVAAIVAAAVLLASRAWLYYPLSLLSTLGVLVGWGLVNAVVVTVATRREQRAATGGDAALLLLAGVVLTLCEVAVVDVVRHATT